MWRFVLTVLYVVWGVLFMWMVAAACATTQTATLPTEVGIEQPVCVPLNQVRIVLDFAGGDPEKDLTVEYPGAVVEHVRCARFSWTTQCFRITRTCYGMPATPDPHSRLAFVPSEL